MKKDCCERCGKELGYFSRGYSLNQPRLKLQYDCLCSGCNRVLKQAVDQIERMFSHMITRLKEDYHVTNMGMVDIDTLIYLAVEAIVSIEPHYYDEKHCLNQTIINRTERSADKMRDMAKIVYRLIDYGFASNLQNAELGNFSSYFSQSTLFIEQIHANCSIKVPRTWVNLFVSAKGMILEQVETSQIVSVDFPSDKEVRYAIRHEEKMQEIRLTNVTYEKNGGENVCLMSEEKQIRAIRYAIDQFNELLKDRKEQKRRETLNIIAKKLRTDLTRVKPDDPVSSLHVDCILLCLVKNLKSDPEIPDLDLYNPYGLAVDLLVRDYLGNFLMLGIRTREDMIDYIRSNCLFAEGFNIKYEDTQDEPGWGFFTTRGYILCFKDSKRLMFIYEDIYPNDNYYPCNDLIYKGVRYLQLPTEDQKAGAKGYRDFNGIIFFSDDVDVIGEMSRFFVRNNLFYQMDQYILEEQRIYQDRENVLEVKRICDHLFRDFGYIPFCLYSEWAAIQNAVGEEDPFINQLIEKRNNGHQKRPTRETSYTNRIVDAFNKGGKELSASLHIDDESIARGIMWSYFNDSLVDNLSREWIRLGGDCIKNGESLEVALDHYSNLTVIDPGKAYYLGLFIYYLIDKRVLPDDDFLTNYERALPVYTHCQRKIAYDGEVEIPAILFKDDSKKKESIEEPDEVQNEEEPESGETDTPEPDENKKEEKPSDIDDWALTQEEANQVALSREKEKEAGNALEMKQIIKKVLNDDGDIVEVTREVPVKVEETPEQKGDES
jgi:hypothetical protein